MNAMILAEHLLSSFKELNYVWKCDCHEDFIYHIKEIIENEGNNIAVMCLLHLEQTLLSKREVQTE